MSRALRWNAACARRRSWRRGTSSACARGWRSSLRRVRRQLESFVEPSRDPAGHDLHRAAEFGKAKGAPRRPVAMGASAVGDEEGVRRPMFQLGADDLAVGQVDRAGDMARSEEGGLRTSRSTKSAPRESVSWTSQQSVSKVNSAAKCSRAIGLGAAGTAVTALGIGCSWSGHAVISPSSLLPCNWLECQSTGRSCQTRPAPSSSPSSTTASAPSSSGSSPRSSASLARRWARAGIVSRVARSRTGRCAPMAGSW